VEEENGAEVQALDVVVEVLDSTPWMRRLFPRYKISKLV
jgi:hypothetical protein